MASDANEFNKYIIGKIIKSIHYDAVTNEIRLDEISVTEAEIEEIVAEGSLRNLTRDHVIELIKVLSENISFNPSIESGYSTVYVEQIERGKYLRVYFDDDHIGNHHIDLIYLGERSFFVIDSTIGCIQYSDIIESTNKLWHPAHSIDFIVRRNNIRYPNSRSYLRVGKLEKVDWYTPAYVYEIIDAKATKEGKKSKSLNPTKDVLRKIKSSSEAATLSKDYYAILGSWLLLGGNSYTLSLIIEREVSLDESNKSKDLSFFYEAPVEQEANGGQNVEETKVIRNRRFGWFGVLFITISLILAVLAIKLYSKTSNLISEKEELAKEKTELAKSNQELTDSIADIYSYYKAIYNVEMATGAPIKLSSTSKDNSWGMWVYASCPLIIKSFDVMAEHSGTMRVGLYDTRGVLLEEKDINVASNRFVTTPVAFRLTKKGFYYLCITEANDNDLSYHSSSDTEYDSYIGHLKVTGCCSKTNMGKDSAKTQTNYYQYFYNIKYQLLY